MSPQAVVLSDRHWASSEGTGGDGSRGTGSEEGEGDAAGRGSRFRAFMAFHIYEVRAGPMADAFAAKVRSASPSSLMISISSSPRAWSRR